MKWKSRERQIAQMRERLRGERYKAPMPDLSIDREPPACGCGFARVGGPRQLPSDANHFPVGHSHKQGTELLTPGMIKNDLAHMGGRKT